MLASFVATALMHVPPVDASVRQVPMLSHWHCTVEWAREAWGNLIHVGEDRPGNGVHYLHARNCKPATRIIVGSFLHVAVLGLLQASERTANQITFMPPGASMAEPEVC